MFVKRFLIVSFVVLLSVLSVYGLQTVLKAWDASTGPSLNETSTQDTSNIDSHRDADEADKSLVNPQTPDMASPDSEDHEPSRASDKDSSPENSDHQDHLGQENAHGEMAPEEGIEAVSIQTETSVPLDDLSYDMEALVPHSISHIKKILSALDAYTNQELSVQDLKRELIQKNYIHFEEELSQKNLEVHAVLQGHMFRVETFDDQSGDVQLLDSTLQDIQTILQHLLSVE